MSVFSPNLTPFPISSHGWRGKSGYMYDHLIYSIHNIPAIDSCNYILARPIPAHPQGFREALYIGQTGDGNNRLSITNHEKFEPALRLGATEIHIHQSAHTRQSRFDIETDIRGNHRTLLNEQPTTAQAGFNGLTASSAFGSPIPVSSLASPPPFPSDLSGLSALAYHLDGRSSILEALTPDYRKLSDLLNGIR